MKAVIAAALAALSLAACQPKPVVPEADASAASSVAAPLSPDEQGLTTPEAFLQALYAHYRHQSRTTDPDWNWQPWNIDAPDYFDADMVALLKKNASLSGDEIGALDGDPFCDCQDYGRLDAKIGTAVAGDKATGTVFVTETDPGARAEDRKPRMIIYDLVKVDGKWRIHDIHGPMTPSLRVLLTTSNKELAGYVASASASS